MGPTPTHFDSAYNVGDTIYIMLDNGEAAQTSIADIAFRPGFTPTAFVPATDFIYTTTSLAIDGITPLARPEGFCFVSKATMKTYIDTLP